MIHDRRCSKCGIILYLDEECAECLPVKSTRNPVPGRFEPMQSHVGDSRCICTDGREAERDVSDCCFVIRRGPLFTYERLEAPPLCFKEGTKRP